ncbi:hypothetical protein BGW80DRAFT_1320377 [Lactifluus volemus]|nr:hypothetical protein BGW80DRAFT_1320377 [Lactifluus volemus]
MPADVQYRRVSQMGQQFGRVSGASAHGGKLNIVLYAMREQLDFWLVPMLSIISTTQFALFEGPSAPPHHTACVNRPAQRM